MKKLCADMEPSPPYIGNFKKEGSGEYERYAGIRVNQECVCACVCICTEY